MQLSWSYLLVCLVLLCAFQLVESDDYASTYGWRQRTSQDHQLPVHEKPVSFITFWLCLLRTILVFYWRAFRSKLSDLAFTCRSPLVATEHIDSRQHQEFITQLIQQLTTQRYEARELHRQWIEMSVSVPPKLIQQLHGHLAEWHTLLHEWNATLHHCPFDPSQCHTLVYYQWQLTNQSITRIYQDQLSTLYPAIHLKITSVCYPENRAICDELLNYLDSIHDRARYETDRLLRQQLKHVQRNAYLQAHNAMYHHYPIQPQAIQLSDATLEQLNRWWVEEVEATIPWYLYIKRDTFGFWQCLMFLWQCLMDYMYLCIERFNQLETQKLFWGLDLSLERLLRI